MLAASGDLPDVVLMDLQMPTMDGVTATAEIKRRWPDVEVVAVTSFVEEAKIRAALEAGATGYLLKDADAGDVAAAIRAAVAGEVHLDPAAAKALTAALRAPRSAADALTPREREVLVLLATGAPTGRSEATSASPSAPRAPTSPTSSPSSAWRAAPRRRCGRSRRASSRPGGRRR